MKLDDTQLKMPNALTRHLMPVGESKTPSGMMHGLAHGELEKMPNSENLHGRPMLSQLDDPEASGHYAYSYRAKNHTLRMNGYRLASFGNKGMALYDHNSAEKETKNIAVEQPEVVSRMLPILKARMNKNDKY